MRISDWSSDVCSSDLVADLLGVLFLFGQPLLDRPADRQVAVHRVVGAGLVGDRVGTNAALDHPRPDLGGVAEQRDRLGLTGAGVLLDARKGVVEVARLLLRSEEHTSELQSLMRISYAVCCLKT